MIATGSARKATYIATFAFGTLLLLSPIFYAIAVTRGRETWSALIPLTLFVLLAAAMWPHRKADAVAPSTAAS